MAQADDIAALVSGRTRLEALASYAVLDTAAEQDFDDLAHLAARLCDAPVALISFVAADRQWFKAKVGFEPGETDLDRSVCRFVLAEPDLLVVPDLSQDPRTRANPLVTHDPHIRFYAGAPIRTAEGEVLGSLCVIDTQPRPDGLTPGQADDLRRLARQVMGQLQLRRLLRQRDDALAQSARAAEALTRSEAHWRGLFQNLQEGFVLARAERDLDGRIVDWRYVDVNLAWSELTGLDGSSVVGRTVREVLPGIEPAWIEVAEVVDTGETVSFTRQVGDLERWYEGRAGPLGGELFSILFLEVTERIRSAKAMAASSARKAALAELSDHLRAAQSADAMSFTAASILGRTLGACRAGYGAVDARRDRIQVSPDWCAPGVVSVAGAHSFRTFGSYIEELKQGRTVMIADAEADPRTRGEGAAALAGLKIGALVNSPIVEHGELVAVSFAHFDRPRTLDPEELAFVRAITDRTQVSIARLRAEERQAVLNGEISHRLKNVLALVQAVAAQTLRGRADADAISSFNQRLAALAKAQDMLLGAEWRGADLAAVVDEVLKLVGAEARCETHGPPVQIGSGAAFSTSLLLHELATNACKYGALSTPEGRLEVSWRLEGVAETQDVVLEWRERGGPPAAPPTRKGFGSRLLGLGLAGTGDVQLNFDDSGFSAVFRAPLVQLEQA